MNKQQLFCEIEFLQKFFKNQPSFNIENSTEFEIWDNYKKLFLQDCSLIFNDKQKYEKLVFERNELFVILNKRCDGGVIDIKFDNIDYDNIQTDQINQIFFLTDTNQCKKIEDDYGMISISNDTMNENAHILFDQSTIPIEKKGSLYSDWNFLDNYFHPCNAMIIADNYLLKNENDLKTNLLPLLDKLLPKALNKLDFQLTIITGDGKSNIDVKSRYEFLNRELQKLGRTYKIKFRIIGKSEGNHDRNLITNYLHIYSGYGFNLFKKKDYPVNAKNTVLANTIISINPIVCKNDINAMVLSLRNQYKLINMDAKNIGTVITVYPSHNIENRIINNLD